MYGLRDCTEYKGEAFLSVLTSPSHRDLHVPLHTSGVVLHILKQSRLEDEWVWAVTLALEHSYINGTMVTFCQEEERDFSNTTAVNQERAWKKKNVLITPLEVMLNTMHIKVFSPAYIFFCRAEVFNAFINPFKYFSENFLSKAIRKMCEAY